MPFYSDWCRSFGLTNSHLNSVKKKDFDAYIRSDKEGAFASIKKLSYF